MFAMSCQPATPFSVASYAKFAASPDLDLVFENGEVQVFGWPCVPASLPATPQHENGGSQHAGRSNTQRP